MSPRKNSCLYVCIVIVACLVFCSSAFGLTLSGVQKYETPVSYVDEYILIAEDGFVIYDSNSVFENCVVDVNGLVEFNSDIDLINSTIRVKGRLKIKPGITITETGPSSIIASGDNIRSGEITIEGSLGNPIIVDSDIATTDSEFIIIDPNSSSNSTLKYIDFFGGWVNIQIYNKELSEAISNCRFYGADYAVYQNGNDELTDVRFSLFYWNYLSIYLEQDGTYDGEVECLIDNVVIDNNFGNPSYGIVISGLQTTPDFTSMNIKNSIITNSHYGLYIMANGGFYIPNLSNLAYYGNYYDGNYSLSEENPMSLTQSPFLVPSDPNDWPYYIDPNSQVANVELGYDLWQSAPEQLLTTIHKNSGSRGNVGIGFGMPLPDRYSTRVYPLQCDFDDSGIVDIPDFAIVAADWFSEKGSLTNPVNYPDPNGYSVADLNCDEIVDTNDLQNFCQEWLSSGQVYLVVNEDSNSITITTPMLDGIETGLYAIFVDGKHIASRDPEYNTELVIEKMLLSKDNPTLQAVIKGEDGTPYVTEIYTASISTPLSSLEFEEFFDPAKYYPISGKVDLGRKATISILDSDKQIMWSEDFTEDFNVFVDPNVIGWEDVGYEIAYSYDPNLYLDLQLQGTSSMTFDSAAESFSGSASILALGGKPSYETAGLLICMIKDGITEGASYTDTGTVRYARKKMKQKGIKDILLLGYGSNNQVNFSTFDKVVKKYPNIRYMHIYAHGHFESDGAGFWGFDIPRTRLRFNDGDWPAYNSRMWTKRGLDVPENYDYLSDDLEAANHLAMFPFQPGQIVVAVVESCETLRNVATMDSNGVVEYIENAYEYETNPNPNLNAHPNYPYSDVSMAFNIWTDKQVVLGSADLVIKGDAYPYWKRFFNSFWNGLADGKSAYYSLMDEAIPVASQDVINGFRYRGIGLSNAYLKKNP